MKEDNVKDENENIPNRHRFGEDHFGPLEAEDPTGWRIVLAVMLTLFLAILWGALS
jgi:hypothetical protein